MHHDDRIRLRCSISSQSVKPRQFRSVPAIVAYTLGCKNHSASLLNCFNCPFRIALPFKLPPKKGSDRGNYEEQDPKRYARS
jgi:hypothetical protein